jgi:hypothetical protein
VLIAAASLVGFPTKAVDADVMEKKPEPTKPTRWEIYVSIGVGVAGDIGGLLGTIEAADEKEAIEKAPAKWKQFGRKLLAVPARHRP